MRTFHFSVPDWYGDAGGTYAFDDIQRQHDNENVPFRSRYVPLAHAGDAALSFPTLYGWGTLVPGSLWIWSVDAAGTVMYLAVGRDEVMAHEYEAGPNPIAQGVPKVMEPFLFRPPFAFTACFAIDDLDNDAWHMIGARQWPGGKVPNTTPDRERDLEATLAGLTLANPAASTRDKNAIAGMMFHGGDPNGTYRQFRKGVGKFRGHPATTCPSSKANPLSFGGGPLRGPSAVSYNPNKYAYRGGVLVTSEGAAALIGGQGDEGSEFQVVPFAGRQHHPDTSGAWECCWITGTNDTFANEVDTAGGARIYTVTAVQYDSEAELEQMIGQGKVLVI